MTSNAGWGAAVLAATIVYAGAGESRADDPNRTAQPSSVLIPVDLRRIKADLDKAGKGAFTLTLTEFPDPEGQAMYFQLADPKVAVSDELIRPVGAANETIDFSIYGRAMNGSEAAAQVRGVDEAKDRKGNK